MNWNAISAISEVIGAIAVVVSLIYLALQIRQNTKAVRGTTINSLTQHMRDELRWSSDMAPAWKKVMETPDELNFEESWQLSEWVTAAFNSRQNEWLQYQQGLIGKEIWEAQANVIQIIMGIDWTQKWWRDYGSKNLLPSFVAEVERVAAIEQRDPAGELSELLYPDKQ